MKSRCKLLACLASKSWGWRKHSLRRVFTATQRSIMDYSAAAYHPYLSGTQMEKLEVTQRKCIRLITGQYSNTNKDALYLESSIPTYSTHSKRLIATAYEKGMRQPDNHPRRTAIDKTVTHRAKLRSSLRVKGQEYTASLPTSDSARRPLPSKIFEPWTSGERNWKVTPNQDVKRDIPAVLNVIESLQADVVIYTDGSCAEGLHDGGAAAVVTTGTASVPVQVDVRQAKGDKHTCSYQEEERALLLGLDWVEEHPQQKTAICTDSLSLLQAMDSLNPTTSEVRSRIESLPGSFDLLYVPGHKDVPGNELADQFAKEAAGFAGPYARGDVSMEAACSAIKAPSRMM